MHSELDASPLAHRLERLNGRFDDFTRVGLAFDEHAATALHSTPFEQPIDERLQPHALLTESVDAAVFELGIAAAQAKGLGEHTDRRERRAQLVRHFRDEVALQLGEVGLAPNEDPYEHAARDDRPGETEK